MPLKLLVTGTSGYIGSHFAKYFKKAGHAVFGLDMVAPASPIKRYLDDDIQSDISDSSAVSEFLSKHKMDAVVHCAAKCLVGESVEKPDLYQDYNVTRPSRFVETVLAANVRAFLFSSTAATYGEPITLPISETHPQKPINPYGKTKLEFERQLLKLEKENKVHVGIFRYFNAAGADPESEIGEIHDPETHLIPNALKAVLHNGKSMQVFGNDYPTRDGTCERDFIHVWDLAKAHLLLVEQLVKTKQGGIYNLGTGSGYTVSEVLKEVEKQTGKKVPMKISPRRPGDPAVLVADPTRANNELGWKPEYSSLSQIIDTAFRFYKQ